MPGAPQPAKLKEGKIYPGDLYRRQRTQPNTSLNTDFFFKKGLIYVLGGGVSDRGAPSGLGLATSPGERPMVTTLLLAHNAGRPLPQDETAAGRARRGGPQGQFVFHRNSSINGDHVHRMKAEDGLRTALRSEGTKVGSGPHSSPPTVPTRCHPGHKAPAQRTRHVSLFSHTGTRRLRLSGGPE